MTNVIQITQLVQNVVLAPKQHLKLPKKRETQQSTEEQFHLADNLESCNYFLSFIQTKKMQTVLQRSHCGLLTRRVFA